MWHERSLMVVGDVDQSIYSWRKADYRIFLGFQSDYPSCRIIKLEENYRSTATILDIANSIIANNTERIEKVLRCNRSKGAKGQYFEATDQIDEAFYVVEEIKRLKARGRPYSDCTILYRTNAQSRSIEEILIRSDIPYTVVGGTRFYDRLEIKDMVAYLKLVYNPKDGQAFNRIVNQPKRGIGKTSLERLAAYAEERGMSSMEACLEAQRVSGLSTKTASALALFANSLFSKWQRQASPASAYPISGLIEMIVRDSGYMAMLQAEAEASGDELAYSRVENVNEFIAVAKEFEATSDQPDLESFLTRISLISDLDSANVDDGASVRLMTLHSAKGLEFPVVFIVGLEEGILPHSRSYDSETAMEEERRLMYVGVTRAEDLLYLTRARKRTFFNQINGGSAFSGSQLPASRFLKEITPGLLTGYYPSSHDGDEPDFDDHDSHYSGTNRYGRGGSYSHNNDRGKNKARGGNHGRGDSHARGDNASPAGGSRTGAERSYPSSGYSRTGAERSSYPSSGYSGSNGVSGSNGYSGSKPSGRSGSTAAGPRRKGQADSAAQLEMRRQGLRAYSDKGAGNLSNQAPGPGPVFERLVVGDKVQHVKFGIGTVIDVISPGEKELYNIDFGEPDKKRIMDPRFAKLIKLS
jgi:DNA helicase-2/ATP-dependent DNA helicase PcrA